MGFFFWIINVLNLSPTEAHLHSPVGGLNLLSYSTCYLWICGTKPQNLSLLRPPGKDRERRHSPAAMNRLMQRLSFLSRPFLRHVDSLNAAASSLGDTQTRGIRVYVRDGNLEKALGLMDRKMRWSGMERLIKGRARCHLKNSEKKVIAKKKLMIKVRSQELSRKLRQVMVQRLRLAFWFPPIVLFFVGRWDVKRVTGVDFGIN